MEGVCSLRLPQHSLVDRLVGFECRHLAASRWTPREGPNSCPTVVVVVVRWCFVVQSCCCCFTMVFYCPRLLLYDGVLMSKVVVIVVRWCFVVQGFCRCTMVFCCPRLLLLLYDGVLLYEVVVVVVRWCFIVQGYCCTMVF